MKKTIQSFLFVLALMVTADTAYATNSFATANGDGSYTGTLFGTISAQADSWMELDKGNGYQQYNRRTNPAGEITAQAPGLACGRTYPYRTGAINPFNSQTVYGPIFNLVINCNTNTGGGNTNNTINVTTDSANASQFSATMFASVNPSADSWIETNLGNGIVRFGQGTRSGSFQAFASGLRCNSTYYYRAVAQGSNGLVYGTTRNFTTDACNTNTGGGNTNNNISAITTAATGVNFTSARLNGIGIVNGTTPTTAYFEYGTSASLGNRTTSRTYFESNSIPVVDVVTGLSQGTTYYYRVVTQNANGTAYGGIQTFRTEVVTSTPSTNTNTNTSTNTNTTRTVTNTATTRATTGTTNSGIVYIPVQLAQIGTVATGVNGATAVPTLATVQVVKSAFEGCDNTFTITYTNTSDKVLSNVLVNVNLPNELAFVSASEGSFRETDNTLTVSVGSLGARESKTVTVNTKVLAGAQVGKTVSVTSYLNYTEGASNAQDQVTGYTLLTLGEGCETTVVGTSQAGAAGLSGILPNTLWQWLLVIFALVLIIVAGRSLFGGAAKTAAH